MNEETIKFLISRLLEKAKDTVEESKGKTSDPFYSGKKLAYYEMLDVLQSELEVRDQDLEKFGLNIDLLKKLS